MKIDHFLNFKRDVIRENIVVFELLKGQITHENRLVSEKKNKKKRRQVTQENKTNFWTSERARHPWK